MVFKDMLRLFICDNHIFLYVKVVSMILPFTIEIWIYNFNIKKLGQ